MMRHVLLSLALAFPVAAFPVAAAAQTIGQCAFDPATLSFAGTPVVQAECLLQHVAQGGVRSEQPLPKVLRALLETGGAPPPGAIETAIARFPEPYRAYAVANAGLGISHTEAGLPARYFVIHDTSSPFLRDAEFPRDLDHDPQINSFAAYIQTEPVAHIFLNRGGQIWAGHDFSQPWRATKLESFVVGAPAKGRFVHVETVQPRRFAPGSQWHGDTLAPTPGFSDAQYRMLAALYVYASARAEMWLIPGFHNGVDAGIPEAHDDPQSFDLNRFGKELEKLLKDARHVSAA